MSKKASTSVFRLQWWKWLCILLLFYTVIRGFLVDVPKLPILHETIRNLFFHVTMWFAMLIVMTSSLVYGLLFLIKNKMDYDLKAEESAKTGIMLGILGLLTGS